MEPKEKPSASAETIVKQIPRDKVIVTTLLIKFRVTDQGLPALRSRGVVMSPIITTSSPHDSGRYMQLLHFYKYGSTEGQERFVQ